ncbi:MAG: M15 family metallopeptidase [Cyanobacteria bacterium P01_H01_bin.121]
MIEPFRRAKPQRFGIDSTESTDDIPVAVRDTLETSSTSTSRVMDRFIWGGVAGISLAALMAGGWLAFSVPRNGEPPAITTDTPDSNPIDAATPAVTSSETLLTETQPDDALLGHRRYDEADPESLVLIAGSDILLHTSAAAAYEEMSAAADLVGLRLTPLSGFRTIEIQRYLFFEIKAERGQNASERAEVSAPPGHSEHHTGYAIDIGDYDYPATDLSVSFAETPAFAWLDENAAFYGFELSFPEGNPQGVTYEPWHWRYVGDQDSLELFYKAQPRSEQSESLELPASSTVPSQADLSPSE